MGRVVRGGKGGGAGRCERERKRAEKSGERDVYAVILIITLV